MCLFLSPCSLVKSGGTCRASKMFRVIFGLLNVLMLRLKKKTYLAYLLLLEVNVGGGKNMSVSIKNLLF